jgi:hypothetical protein
MAAEKVTLGNLKVADHQGRNRALPQTVEIHPMATSLAPLNYREMRSLLLLELAR